MEKVRIRTAKERTKILGTMVCVAGALIFTFCKGHLMKGLVKKPLIVIRGTNFHNGREVVNGDWIKGSLVILTSLIILSAWIVLQGVIFEAYPARLSLNALMFFFTSLQSSVGALIFERNKSSWQLGWNIQLVAVIYTGIVISILVNNLQAYCISEKGHLFSAIFYPVILVIMGIFSASFYAERLHLGRKQRPPLSSLIIVKIFILALFGITIQQNIYFAGLQYTSPTVAGALSCVSPAGAFILALLLRMEKVRIRTAKGRAKLLGTLLCVTGALVFTFWKGLQLKGFVKRPFIIIRGSHFRNAGDVVKEDWVKGSLVLLTSQIMFCVWIVFQGVIFEAYPARLSMNALMCFFTSLQSSVVVLIFDRNKSSWKLGWNIQLLAVFYTGIVISFMVYNLQTYCISEKGPLFSAIFNPLMLVIIAIFSTILYAERLHLGSLIGAIIIIIGLYSVVWGKTGDDQHEEKNSAEELQTATQNSRSCNAADRV